MPNTLWHTHPAEQGNRIKMRGVAHVCSTFSR